MGIWHHITKPINAVYDDLIHKPANAVTDTVTAIGGGIGHGIGATGDGVASTGQGLGQGIQAVGQGVQGLGQGAGDALGGLMDMLPLLLIGGGAIFILTQRK